MGYYWNQLDERWHEIDHDRQLTRQQQQQITRRSRLIVTLMKEIATSNNSAIALYAGLLARELTGSDELLVREHAKQLAALMPDRKKKQTKAA